MKSPTPTRIAAYRDRKAEEYGVGYSGMPLSVDENENTGDIQNAYRAGFGAGREVGKLEGLKLSWEDHFDPGHIAAQLDELLGGKE